MREAPLTHEIVAIAKELPFPHQDPADRFSAATAGVLGLTLVTADHRLLGLGTIATLGKPLKLQLRHRQAIALQDSLVEGSIQFRIDPQPCSSLSIMISIDRDLEPVPSALPAMTARSD